LISPSRAPPSASAVAPDSPTAAASGPTEH